MALLNGKTALIVGIANDRWYAWHIAKSLMEQGARLAFTHLPGEKNSAAPGAVEELGITNPWLTPLDAASDEQIDTAITRYAESFDKMDILIHSIAFADREWLQAGKFVETPRAAYLNAIDISAYTLLALANRSRDLLAKSGNGSIMAMSYYGGEKVVPGYNLMGVAKSALETTARYLAWELGPQKIRVNIISGGYLRTLASSAVGGVDEMTALSEQKSPLRRPVDGSDVGNTAAFLASDLSRGITGETIYVDCGLNTVGV